MKVLHLAGTNRGATWMMEQLKGLKARGHDVCAYVSGEGPLTEKLETEGIDYRVVNLSMFWTLKESHLFVRCIFNLAWQIWKDRYDVVHAHLFPTMVISRLAAWMVDAPIRISMIPGPFYAEAEIPALIEKSTVWMDTRIIASCEYTRTIYKELGTPTSKIELVYYGADEEKFKPEELNKEAEKRKLLAELGLNEGTQLVGLVAYFYQKQCESRFVPDSIWGQSIKNHETVVNAVASVVSACPDAHFVFVGDGWGEEGEKYRQSIIEDVKERGLSKHVSFLGHRDDIPALLSTFDVSLQCSLNENLGGTIESLLMERPMVGSRIGGIVDSIKHEKTGLLIEPKDSENLADSIIRLLEDRNFAMKLAKNGRQLMLEQFSLNKTVKDLDEIYERCSKDRSTSSAGYRWYVIPFRLVAALWWIYSVVMLICDDEIKRTLRAYDDELKRTLQASQRRVDVFTQCRSLTQEKENWIRFYFDLFKKIAWESIVYACCKIRRFFYLSVKRLGDIVASSVLLIASLPLFLVLLITNSIKATTTFNKHTVLGAHNRPFTQYSLNMESQVGTGKNLLRSLFSKLQFLPVFWNIFLGDMSLVGPRPRSTDGFDSEDPDNYSERWSMAPGLTGWSQLNKKKLQSSKELNGHDFLYIAHSGLILDTKILLKSSLLAAQKVLGQRSTQAIH